MEWGRFSVSIVSGSLKLATQCSLKLLEIAVGLFFVIGIALVRLEYRFIITTMYLISTSVLGKGSNTTMAIRWREPTGGIVIQSAISY